jgi:hypothetical protein
VAEDAPIGRWIDLDGAANARDCGGLPLAEGGRVRAGRLLRSDNLQDLTARDVRILVDDIGLRTVVDLRMHYEVAGAGPGPLTREPEVTVSHLSLYRDTPEDRPGSSAAVDPSEALPWQRPTDASRPPAHAVYRGYLTNRADAVIEALRLIAHSPGASLVHCAAGKDRTGVIVALALSEIGVPRDAVVADYVGDGARIGRVLDRLHSAPAYDWSAKAAAASDAQQQVPQAETMIAFLEGLDATDAGPRSWLRSAGWTDTDAAALRLQLVG